MSDQILRTMIDRICPAITEHTEELTELDQAIGDGDHGLNMARGFGAIDEIKDEICGLEFGEALKKAGMTLVMKVGGASGPLYGSLLMSMGKAQARLPAGRAECADMFNAGIEAVKARGKSDVGAKTMLDVLVPVYETLRAGGSIDELRSSADASLENTRDMIATKGRAAFLGERSQGHLDPGARSSNLLVHSVCDVLEEQ